MDKKYNNLNALINSDSEAKKYYDSLPDYVKDHINTRSENIVSYETLQVIADNFLSGDK